MTADNNIFQQILVHFVETPKDMVTRIHEIKATDTMLLASFDFTTLCVDLQLFLTAPKYHKTKETTMGTACA